MKISKTLSILILVSTLSANAELAVHLGELKIVGQKAVVPLEIKNNLPEKIESARAVVFLLDGQGKMVNNATRWVIGGQAANAQNVGLPPGGTNIFNFVITSDKPFNTTNISAKVSFTRVLLEGGRLADIAKEVRVQQK
jgi:hypothetical protein